MLSVLATHLTEVIKQHADEILGRQETQNLIDNLKKSNQSLVDEVVPDLLSVGDIQKVLANLLRERISIRDMATIMEVLADYAHATKDTEILTEYVRHAMARSLTQANVQNGILPCVTLDPALENRIAGGVQRTDHGSYVSLDPDSMQRLLQSLDTAAEAYQYGVSAHCPDKSCSKALFPQAGGALRAGAHSPFPCRNRAKR